LLTLNSEKKRLEEQGLRVLGEKNEELAGLQADVESLEAEVERLNREVARS